MPDILPPDSSITQPERRPRRPLGAILAVAWVMLVVSAYYAVHKPASPMELSALAIHGRTVAGLVGTLSLAQSLGRLWSRMIPALGDRARFALELGLGLASLSYLVLLLGAFGAYHPALAWGLTVLSLPFGLRRLAVGLRRALPRMPRRPSAFLLAALVVALLVAAAIRALAPPTAWDSLVYHLTGPKLYLQSGALHHNLDLPHLGFPQAGAMLFTWGMLLGSDRLAQWMPLTFAVLTLALLPEVARRLAPRRSWLAAAVLISVPTAYQLTGVAYVEWLAMFAGLASLVLLGQVPAQQPSAGRQPRAPAAPDARTLVTAGFLAALAINAKFTTIWLVLGLAVVVQLRARSWSATIIFLGAAAGSVFPFLLKNLLLVGNPVYPFFFGGAFWDPHRAWWYSRPGTGLNAVQLLIAPWEATVWSVEGGVYQGHPSYAASIGPLILALTPASLLKLRTADPKCRSELLGLLVVTGCAYLGWLGQLAYSRLLVQTRLLLPVLPQLALLAAAGFEGIGSLPRWGRSARFVVGGLVGLSLTLMGTEVALEFAARSPLAVVSGAETQREYLRSRLGQHALVMEGLQQLPPQSRLRFLWEPRSYYCPAQISCEPDALTDRWWHERQHGRDASAIAQRWRGEGVTHILHYGLGAQAIRQAGFDPLTDADWVELERFLSEFLVPVADFSGVYTLYRWR